MSKKIVLIVGPSGVGKDTLLKYSKKVLKENSTFNFVKRYITRKPDSNEKNYYVQEEAFDLLKKEDFFVSSWQAHENLYGISKSSVQNGVNIISISRSHVQDFERVYDEVYTIHVTIPKELLLQRLRLRARESEAEIMQRFKRTYETIDAKNLIEFDNSKNIEASCEAFVTILEEIANK